MATTPEPLKGVPRIEGNPTPTLRADHNALADWVRDHTGESVPAARNLPTSGNWPGRSVLVLDVDTVFRYRSAERGWVADRRTVTGTFRGLTDKDGYVTIQHGLGVIPKVFTQARNQDVTAAIARIQEPQLWGLPTATSFQIRMIRRDTNDYFFDAQNVSFDWMAVA